MRCEVVRRQETAGALLHLFDLGLLCLVESPAGIEDIEDAGARFFEGCPCYSNLLSQTPSLGVIQAQCFGNKVGLVWVIN